MNPAVFREYDIRGVVGKDLTDDFVKDFSKAISAYWADRGVKKVSLGMDARLSSPRFMEILKKGITESGIDVIDIGMVPSPVLYFSLFKLDVDGGLQITGSHNPSDNNGFKIAVGKTTIYGKEIQKVREYMEGGSATGSGSARDSVPDSGPGTATSCDIMPEYLEDVISRIRNCPKKLRIVVDPGNGVGGGPAREVLEALGMEVIGICMEPDGNFPNHHPDPTTEDGVKMLREEVLKQEADLGIGFDGDADRIGVIDSSGNTVYGDMITAVLAKAILKDKPGEKIVGEVKCSSVLFDEIEKAGGIPIMGKVGHSLMKARLTEENAALAGEMSGHIFFNERWYGFDDAVYSAARLVEILSSAESPQAVFDELPKMENTPEIRFACPDEIKFEVVEKFASSAKEKYENCVDIDGVRFDIGDGWGLVRPSNTQPVIVMRFEAHSSALLEKIMADTKNKLNEIIAGY